MAETFFLLRNDDIAVCKEGTYGVSPGNPVAGDFFKSETSRVDIKTEAEKFERDSDRDYGKASVTEMHVGRRKSSFTIKGRFVPSGNAATPTEPDMDLFFEAAFGSKHKCTAHSTTAAGSVGTTLELVVGGGAATGLQAGDLFAVDVSAAVGIEVRRVVSIATIAAVAATATIGSGVNGTVTVTADVAGVAGNAFGIEVKLGVGANTPLSASLVGSDITVNLASDADSFPDNAENTATLVAVAVAALAGVTAVASGTGAAWLNDAEAHKHLAGGVDAPAGDSVVIDRAFTTDPAAARAVYVGTTYKLSESSMISLHAWLFNGDNMRFKLPGAIVTEFKADINHADGAPTAGLSFSCESQPRVSNTTVVRATATTAGTVEVPDVGCAWIGTTKVPLVSASLGVKNGLKLRNRRGDALYPTGVARTENKSRYSVEQTLEMYLTNGVGFDVETLDIQSDVLTARDTLVQLGNAVGKIVAWSTPNWRPAGESTDQDGEIGLKLSGRCYGTTADDEVFLAFI